MRRQWARNRVRRHARRCGRHDERGRLGWQSLAALRRVRALAGLAGVEADELDEVTLDGIVAGRARA